MENLDKKLASLEALLFIHGEALPLKKIEKVLKLGPGEALELLYQFSQVLESDGRGLRLIFDSGKFQLSTKPEFGKILEEFVREELTEDLTPASLEALSIIAYLGPISRSRLEYLRGVNSVFTLRNLMLRGLVERFPDPKRPNAYLYKPSLELIRHLGLGKTEELPDYEEFRDIIEKVEAGPAYERQRTENINHKS